MRSSFLFLILFILLKNSYAQETPSTVENYIHSQQRQTSQLPTQSANELPIGVDENRSAELMQIQNLELSPTSSTITISAVVPLPMSTEKLELAASGVPISEHGFNGGEAKLYLQSPVHFLIGEKIKCTILSGTNGSYASIDCNGLKEVKIKGVIEFCRSLLLPENSNGEILPEPYRVKADFEFSGTGINNMLTNISLPPFQIKGLNGYSFLVEEAWLDRSDTRNPEGITFPKNYQGIEDDFWRGVFIKQVKVKLPNIFKSINNSDVTIQVKNLLIDHSGISGEINAMHVISLGSNNSKWKLSVDTIGIKLSSNVITEGKVAGKVKLPFFDSSDELVYRGVIGMDDYYSFRINSKQNINVSLWLATLNLAPTSTFELQYVEKKWTCALNLNGTISINFNKNNHSGSAHGIQFEHLEVSTEAPYIQGGNFYTNISVCKFKGFQVSFKDISHSVTNGFSKLSFTIDIHFFNRNDLGFQGSSRISILSDVSTNWEFKSLRLESVKIDVDKGAFALKGELDTPYDQGFNGRIEMKIKPGIVILAKAAFGVQDGYNFWSVNASVKLPRGIPIYPAVAIWGFSGGLSYHMDYDTVNQVRTAFGSDREYIPDSTKKLGLSAGILLAGNPNQDLFQVYAELGILFNGFGVTKFSIEGKVFLLHKIDDPITSAPVYATTSIVLDFENDAFHSNSSIYINAWNIIKGIGPNNMAGYMTVHFSKTDWYVHIGKPDNRIGIELFGMAQASSYLLAGKTIPPMPSPSPVLARVLNVEDLNMMRNENLLSNGAGFAFGAALNFSTGRKKFLIFYGEFNAGIEFDIMLKNYGKNVYCQNTGKNLGVEGWYASGQIGAYIQGEIGVDVNLPCYKGSYTILEIGAGVLFQAKLPNPIWMRGMVGGYFSILGGLVEGDCRFEIEVGRQCEINTTRSISYQSVVREVTPFSQNLETYSSLVQPEIYLNLPLNKEINLYNNDHSITKYKVELNRLLLTNEAGESQDIRTEYDSISNKIKITPLSELISNNTYTLSMVFIFQRYNQNNWEIITGGDSTNQKQFTFKINQDTTSFIELSSIKASYPIRDQIGYFINEYNDNFIAFNQLQQCIKDLNNQDYLLLLNLKEETTFVSIPFTFYSNGLEVKFSLKDYLQPAKSYQLGLYHIQSNDTVLIYSSFFETSTYVDFISFLESNYQASTWIENTMYASNDYVLKNKFNKGELIDNTFVQCSFDLECNWLNKNYSQMYHTIDASIFKLNWRPYNRSNKFPTEMIQMTNSSMENFLSTFVYKDFYDVKASIANSTSLMELYHQWLYRPFIPLQKGNYNIHFEYKVPYRNITTSTYTYLCQLKL